MTHHTGSDTNRKADWRDSAACRGNNNDHWFPNASDSVALHSAKAGCFACPVMFLCAQHALRTRTDDGVWGGLSESQRHTLFKNHRTVEFDSLDRVRTLVLHALRAEINPVNTLRSLWEDRSYPLPGGHIGWRGSSSNIGFRGRSYTPKQIAFRIDRGHNPAGIIRRTSECSVVACVNPLHLEDNAERFQRKTLERQAAARAAAQAEFAVEELAS